MDVADQPAASVYSVMSMGYADGGGGDIAHRAHGGRSVSRQEYQAWAAHMIVQVLTIIPRPGSPQKQPTTDPSARPGTQPDR
jgi:hypothetical protein